MSALIPALINLFMSGRGGGGGGGGGGRRGGGGGGGGRGRSGYGRGGGGRSGRSGGGRKPYDPAADLDKKASQFLVGGGKNPFNESAIYSRDDEASWNSIYRQLGGEMEYPEPEIPDDIYDEEEE
jgi:hypothetical protein